MSFGHALTVPVRIKRIRPHLFQNHTFPPHVTHASGTASLILPISSSSASFIAFPGDLDPLRQPSDITLAIRKMLAPPVPDTSSSASPSKCILSTSTQAPVHLISELDKSAQSPPATFSKSSRCSEVSAILNPFSASSPDLTTYAINNFSPLPLRRAQTVPRVRRFPTTDPASSLHRIATANVAKRRSAHVELESASAVDALRKNRDNAPLQGQIASMQPAVYTAAGSVFMETSFDDFCDVRLERSGPGDQAGPEYDSSPSDAGGAPKPRSRESRFVETGLYQHTLASVSLDESRCGSDTQPKPSILKSPLSLLNLLPGISPKSLWLQKTPPGTTLKALVDKISSPGPKVRARDRGVEQTMTVYYKLRGVKAMPRGQMSRSSRPAAAGCPSSLRPSSRTVSMSLQRTTSFSSMASDTKPPSGPLSGPSTTTWRRERLLRIGSVEREQDVSENTASETTPLAQSSARPALRPHHSSYGALPVPNPRRTSSKPSFRKRHGLPALPQLSLPRPRASSNPATPRASSTPYDRASFFSRINGQRPISAYDADVLSESRRKTEDVSASEVDTKTNGIRVWYSSFTSIDWLHDAIKDSARVYRLRRRKSLRGRIRNALDRSIGWLIVTIVGFLTAVVAFLIVRSEQWLFDLKDGYCGSGWWKAKRFCCPLPKADDDLSLLGSYPFGRAASESEQGCGTWRLLLALISSLLTLHFTASTSFVTRKDSGVLSPDFANKDEDGKVSAPPADNPSKRKIMYYAAGSGIPEIKTILSGFVIHGYLGGRTLFTKSVGLALSTASGLSLGKEGPFVHIASCIGNITSRYFNKYETNEGKHFLSLCYKITLGVAVAFGAPIGGTLFSLEEVSYFFPPKVMWRSFFCAMIAAITLRFLDPFGTGKLVLLQVTYDKDWHAYELVPFLLLGVFGGVYGAWFSKLNYRWSRDVREKTWLKTHPASEVLLITLLTAVFSFVNPYTHMGGTELVYDLFAECRTGSPNTHSGLCVLDPATQTWPVVRAIFTALVIRAALTIITFGIKLPAGIFIPSLGVGACAGRIMGILIQYAQWRWPKSSLFNVCGGDMDCVIPGLYAMVGAAASLSGVTRTTVSLAVIMFELTDTLTYAVPVMLSVLVAKTVADALEPKGIYDLVIELAQLPYLDGKQEYLWGHLQISDVADRDVEVIRVDHANTVKSIRDQLQQLVSTGYYDSGFPILREDEGGPRLVGYIGANELEHALSIVADEADSHVHFHNTRASGLHRMTSSSVSSLIAEGSGNAEPDPFDFTVYMDQAPLTVQTNSPLELVQQFFVKLGAKYVIVTDVDGYYEGIIDKKAWLGFLGELEEKAA
ncbi:hypothetical protein EVG20_g64 [Dentipellis fragilis]|uniref:Uncharacterized protein n=1 Tax=Dentipellis fragilis TaxID=205917 RepID=A0A4Y9ZHI4_9AGAM|nr:hypothetical protein EVG20_g64 [Dentipellis fragilis]